VRSNRADLDLLKRAAQDAGRLAMRFFRRSPAQWAKHGGSLVTEADIAVDRFLFETLVAERPDYGWLSEETADDRARLERSAVFVIDPIDGTRVFAAGEEAWCVSLAVVEKRRPVAAALYVPAYGELYFAAAGVGAWLGERRLAASGLAEITGARIAGPRGWVRTAAVLESGAAPQPHISSLAYRFAQVAAARLDGAFASARAHDWDLAASDLLVHEAGGRLTGLDGVPPRYNEPVPRHGVLVAASSSLHRRLLDLVGNASREVARGGRT
jgi:myo-inositol-1(or 4)-monophosphatase